MRRRTFLAGSALTLAGAAPAMSQRAAGPDRRPNIVLIVSDDHGREALGAYGNRVVRTPNIDALARVGTRFTRAFATTASCSPSRSVLLTGRHNHSNGMYGLQHVFHHFSSLDETRSLPLMLSAAGYRTARAGKYHLAPEAVYRFDQVLTQGAQGDASAIGRSPVEMADLTRDFIGRTDAPFFLYFATDDPHRLEPFETVGPNSFGNRAGGYPGVREFAYNPAAVPVPPFLPDLPETRAEIAQYYQAISRLDQGVGQLVRRLKEAGQYDNTLIVYLSDNGPAFVGAKTTLYEPGIRLPLIVKPPAGQPGAGRVADGLVSWADITPTILDYAGVRAGRTDFHGATIRPLLSGAAAVQGRDAIFGSHSFHEIQMYYPMRMVRTERFKLIHNLAWQLTFPAALDLQLSSSFATFRRSGRRLYGPRTLDAFLHRPQFELYDLEADPNEGRNLAGDPAHAARLAALRMRIEAFMRDTGDPWASKLDFE